MFIGLKSKAGKVQMMYPPRMDCKAVDSLFTTNDIIDQKSYLEQANNDRNLTQNYVGGGYFQCYCTKFSNYMVFKQRAKDLAAKYAGSKKNETTVAASSLAAEAEKLKTASYNLCYEYQKDKFLALALTSTVSALVSVVNIGIRNFVIIAIGWIHYDSKSQVTNQIMLFVFVASFINSGFLGLLANSDLYYTDGLGHLLPFLQGQYSDINRDWYITIGPQMVQTMLIMAFFPIIELSIFGSMWKLKQWKDSGPPCCPRKRVQEYDELPEGAVLVGENDEVVDPDDDPFAGIGGGDDEDDPFAGIDNTEPTGVNEEAEGGDEDEDDDPFAGIDNTEPEGAEGAAVVTDTKEAWEIARPTKCTT